MYTATGFLTMALVDGKLVLHDQKQLKYLDPKASGQDVPRKSGKPTNRLKDKVRDLREKIKRRVPAME